MANATIYCNNIRTQDSNAWLMSNAFVVLTMQAGFALLESGMITSRHASNILMKNLVDVAFGAVAFFAVGWALAFGDSGNAFMGTSNFFLANFCDFPLWIFQFAFAATAATIVSGAVAGRMHFLVYCFSSLVVTGFIYPIAAHWVWAETGWLYKLGLIDFAGDGPIHMLGGTIGLVATTILGPRTGVFTESGHHIPVRASPSNTLFGTFILYWGWFAFNAGSTTNLDDGTDYYAGRAATNTAIASGGGVFVAIFYCYLTSEHHTIDVFDTAAATLASLVGITAGCAFVEPWEALIIGAVAAFISLVSGPVLIRLKIDDPIGVAPVHFFPAIWGLVAVGLFADHQEPLGNKVGLFHGGGFYLVGVQLLAVVAIMAWGVVTSLALFYGLSTVTELRVSVQDEEDGLDQVEHNLYSVSMMATRSGMDDELGIGAGGSLFFSTPEVVFVTSDLVNVAEQNKPKSRRSSAIHPQKSGSLQGLANHIVKMNRNSSNSLASRASQKILQSVSKRAIGSIIAEEPNDDTTVTVPPPSSDATAGYLDVGEEQREPRKSGPQDFYLE